MPKLAVMICCLALCCSPGKNASAADAGELDVASLSGPALSPAVTRNSVDIQPVIDNGSPCWEVHFGKVDYPNVFFNAPPEGWDWSDYSGLQIELFNPEEAPIRAAVRVDNHGADGINNCNTVTDTTLPGQTTTLQMTFNTGASQKLWGMRGLPEIGPVGNGTPLDLTKIVAFQIFLPFPDQPHRLLIKRISLFGKGKQGGADVALPFVDPFGQYKHADWPLKIHNESDLALRRETEAASLKQFTPSAELDAYGGWLKGPALQATGWFRTEKVGDNWWLVTPDGHLFLSIGMDCINTSDQTFVSGRESWFEGLPKLGDPLGIFFGHAEGTHSMAEAIGGKGRTFNFYGANLVRKYGSDWKAAWRKTTRERLWSWGFNTIGNWSEQEVCIQENLPFVASFSIRSHVRDIEGAKGYWGPMKDVYDPHFIDVVDESIAPLADKLSGNPRCIGYFSDNELSWETIRSGILASPPDQPARKVLIQKLQASYSSLDQLNKTWGTQAADWDSLRAPEVLNASATKDLDAFAYDFSKVYFQTIRDILKNHAPNQLYLGCRFSSAPEPSVRACADVADVVSFNYYLPYIGKDVCERAAGLNKPVIIGEFHFGATDRGMFHPGLGPCADQASRAKAYADYVRSVVECPAMVGCHWFQYVDEPITGRWFDGENYNIGFVDVSDTPYPELVEAARKIHGEIYKIRGD